MNGAEATTEAKPKKESYRPYFTTDEKAQQEDRLTSRHSVQDLFIPTIETD